MKHIGLGVMAVALLVGVVGFSVYQTTTSRNSSQTEAAGTAQSGDLGLTVESSPLKVNWTGPQDIDPNARYVLVLKNSDGTNIQGSKDKTLNADSKSADYSSLSLPSGQYTAQLRYIPPTGSILVDRENFSIEASNYDAKSTQIPVPGQNFESWNRNPSYNDAITPPIIIDPLGWTVHNNSNKPTPNDEYYRRSKTARSGKYSLLLRSYYPNKVGNEFIWSQRSFKLMPGKYNASIYINSQASKMTAFCAIKNYNGLDTPITVVRINLVNPVINHWSECKFSFAVSLGDSKKSYFFDIGIEEHPYQVSSALFDDLKLEKID